MRLTSSEKPCSPSSTKPIGTRILAGHSVKPPALGAAIPPADVIAAIEATKPAVVFLVQGESSTGVHQSLAGIGPAALNLRFLHKRRVPTPIALATVTLVQVAQFATTIIFLIVLSLATGEVGRLTLPSG